VAGNPKVYGQLVQLLAPYTRVIKGEPTAGETAAAEPDATQAFVDAAEPDATAAPAKRAAVRIRKA